MKEFFAVVAVGGGVGAIYFVAALAERILRFDPNDPSYVPQFSKTHGLGVRSAQNGQPAKIIMVPKGLRKD